MTLADKLNSVAVITVLQFESLNSLYWFATSTAFSNCGLRVPTFSSTSSIKPCAREGSFSADTLKMTVWKHFGLPRMNYYSDTRMMIDIRKTGLHVGAYLRNVQFSKRFCQVPCHRLKVSHFQAFKISVGYNHVFTLVAVRPSQGKSDELNLSIRVLTEGSSYLLVSI